METFFVGGTFARARGVLGRCLVYRGDRARCLLFSSLFLLLVKGDWVERLLFFSFERPGRGDQLHLGFSAKGDWVRGWGDGNRRGGGH